MTRRTPDHLAILTTPTRIGLGYLLASLDILTPTWVARSKWNHRLRARGLARRARRMWCNGGCAAPVFFTAVMVSPAQALSTLGEFQGDQRFSAPLLVPVQGIGGNSARLPAKAAPKVRHRFNLARGRADDVEQFRCDGRH